MRDVFLLYADSRVFHVVNNLEHALGNRLPRLWRDLFRRRGLLALVGQRVSRNEKGNTPLSRVFHSIVHHVQQDLLYSHLVTEQYARDVRVNLDGKVEPLFLGLKPHHTCYIRQHVCGNVVCAILPDAARFKTRHIENLVYAVQQLLAGNLDIEGVLAHFVRYVLAQRHLVQTDDCVHRRANFVAHAREEAILRKVECFDFLLLTLYDAPFGVVNPSDEGEQRAEQQRYQRDGEERFHVLLEHGMPRQ